MTETEFVVENGDIHTLDELWRMGEEGLTQFSRYDLCILDTAVDDLIWGLGFYKATESEMSRQAWDVVCWIEKEIMFRDNKCLKLMDISRTERTAVLEGMNAEEFSRLYDDAENFLHEAGPDIAPRLESLLNDMKGVKP